MPTPKLNDITALFLRIGNLTFGGGDPTVAALGREMVERRGWLDADKFGLAYSLARLTPGTNMLAFCAGAAWFLRGWRAAVAAVLAVTVPSAALVVWVTRAYESSRQNAVAAAAVGGVLAAAVGMMLAAASLLMWPQLSRRSWPRTLLLVLVPAVLTARFSVPPLQSLLVAALGGLLWKEPRET